MRSARLPAFTGREHALASRSSGRRGDGAGAGEEDERLDRGLVLAAAKRAIVGLQIEAPGVVYAFNSVKGIREVGNLVFVPFSRVSAALS